MHELCRRSSASARRLAGLAHRGRSATGRRAPSRLPSMPPRANTQHRRASGQHAPAWSGRSSTSSSSVGVLYYFLQQAAHGVPRRSRSATIRKDLVEAAELKATATAQLAEIEQKLRRCPAKSKPLRARGADEIKAEEQRIAAGGRRRARAAARADAPRNRSAGAPGQARDPRARRRPLGAARRRAHQEGNHAGRSGAAGRSLSRAGEKQLNVAPHVGQPLRERAVRRGAAGEADLAQVDQDLTRSPAMLAAQARAARRALSSRRRPDAVAHGDDRARRRRAARRSPHRSRSCSVLLAERRKLELLPEIADGLPRAPARAPEHRPAPTSRARRRCRRNDARRLEDSLSTVTGKKVEMTVTRRSGAARRRGRADRQHGLRRQRQDAVAARCADQLVAES